MDGQQCQEMRTKIECGGESSSLVSTHADLPLDNKSKLLLTLLSKIPPANIQLVSEASSGGFILTCITVAAAFISRAFSFLRLANTVYTLTHICTLQSIAETRAHGYPTVLFTGATHQV